MASTTRVTWTAEMKDILISAIFETHPDLVINTVKVSEAWPSDKPRPTPRAITEQLVKMRKNGGGRGMVRTRRAKTNPATPRQRKTSSAPGSKQTDGSSGKRKRETSVKDELVKNEGNDGDAEDDEDGDEGGPSPTVRQAELKALHDASGLFGHSTNGSGFDGFQDINALVIYDKDAHQNTDSAVDLESPTKRLKVSETPRSRSQRARKQKPIVIDDDDEENEENEDENGNQENEEDDDQGGSGSEYHDEADVFVL